MNDVFGRAQSAQSPAGTKEWGEIIPFEQSDAPPLFPIRCLPKVFADYSQAIAQAVNAAPDMAGLLCLSVLSTLYQKRYTVQIRKGYAEQLNLYSVCIAPPSARKSPVMDALMRPLYKWQRDRCDLEKLEIAQAESARRILEKQIRNAEEKAAKAGGNLSSVFSLQEELAALPEKHTTRLIVGGDTTQEALAEVMEQQGGVLSMFQTRVSCSKLSQACIVVMSPTWNCSTRLIQAVIFRAIARQAKK